MPNHRYSRFVTASFITVAFVGNVRAQLATIPQQLARVGESLHGGPSIPSGPSPTIERILAHTDLIVRAVVGHPRSYLSDDQMDVQTDYLFDAVLLLYQGVPIEPDVLSLTVTMLGGTITMSGLTFTSKHEGLPLIEPGTDCLLLLKKVGNAYQVAGTYYGAFRISGEKLVPLTGDKGFARQLVGVPAGPAIEELVAQARALHPVGR